LQRLKGLIADLRTDYDLIEHRRLYPKMLNLARESDSEPGIVGTVQKHLLVSLSGGCCLLF
jgi:hypothetical protein